MQRSTSFALALSIVVLSLAASRAANAADGSTIAYRLMKTKTLHFDDAATANQHYEAVEKLGCEVKRDSHGGHTDVMYRLTRWKQITVASEELAHRWEAWLQRAGFETLHGHPAGDGHGHAHDIQPVNGERHDHAHLGEEAVNYRLPKWTTQHFEREGDAEQFVAIAKALGCEVRQDRHDGHNDVAFRCTDWRHAEFPSHGAADRWEKWLKTIGFETRHSH